MCSIPTVPVQPAGTGPVSAVFSVRWFLTGSWCLNEWETAGFWWGMSEGSSRWQQAAAESKKQLAWRAKANKQSLCEKVATEQLHTCGWTKCLFWLNLAVGTKGRTSWWDPAQAGAERPAITACNHQTLNIKMVRPPWVGCSGHVANLLLNRMKWMQFQMDPDGCTDTQGTSSRLRDFM